jgi:hypothetical protein
LASDCAAPYHNLIPIGLLHHWSTGLGEQLLDKRHCILCDFWHVFDVVTQSRVELIATPEKFDGREILVAGFLRLEFEGNCLYLHREDYEHLISKNAIWIVRNPVINAQSNTFNMHYVVLLGTFNATRKGHMSLNSGSLTDITSARLSIRP